MAEMQTVWTSVSVLYPVAVNENVLLRRLKYTTRNYIIVWERDFTSIIWQIRNRKNRNSLGTTRHGAPSRVVGLSKLLIKQSLPINALIQSWSLDSDWLKWLQPIRIEDSQSDLGPERKSIVTFFKWILNG